MFDHFDWDLSFSCDFEEDDLSFSCDFEEDGLSQAKVEDVLSAEGWLWRTEDGEELTLAEMTTRHIFNVAKLFFNHLAEAHGGAPIWFTRPLASLKNASIERTEKCAAIVVFLMEEIDRRGDLPKRYREPYNQIMQQISPVVMPGGRRMLTAAKEV